MMCLADEYAVICLDSIDDENEKKLLIKSLNNTKKEIIEILIPILFDNLGTDVRKNLIENKQLIISSKLFFYFIIFSYF